MQVSKIKLQIQNVSDKMELFAFLFVENFYSSGGRHFKWLYGDISKCLRWKCSTIGHRFDYINIRNEKSFYYLACKLLLLVFITIYFSAFHWCAEAFGLSLLQTELQLINSHFTILAGICNSRTWATCISAQHRIQQIHRIERNNISMRTFYQ